MLKGSKMTPEGELHIRTYAKFCSLYEEEVARVGEEVESVGEEVEEGRVGEAASLALLARLTKFIDTMQLEEAVVVQVWT